MATVNDCFEQANKDEKKGKKHKGLLYVKADYTKAQEYVKKAKTNLQICELYKEKGFDYKIPEEWFYTMYYCALAILAKCGVESRSQKCTALFLRFLKDKEAIEYDNEFIDRITVYSDKDETSDVDEREKARYSSSVKSEEIMHKYDFMMDLCKRCIDQCEMIVFSEEKIVLKLMDKLLEKSELTEEDAERIGHKIKHGIAKRLGLVKE